MGFRWSTTALAAMRELSPTLKGPSTLAPVDTMTLFPRVGWRLPWSLASAAQGDPVVKQAVVADLGGLPDDDAHAVVDDQPPADLRAGVDLNAGQLPGSAGSPAGPGRTAGAGRESGNPVVDEDGVHARVQQKNLQSAPGGRVAGADRPQGLG